MRRSLLAATVVLVAALAVLVVPGAASHTTAGNATAGNGTVLVEISLSGTTAENVTVDDADRVERAVGTELGVPASRVRAVTGNGSTAVEVRAGGVSPEELRSALSATGVPVGGEVGAGLTRSTRQSVAEIVGARLDAMDAYNGSVVRTGPSRLVVRISPRPSAAELSRIAIRGNVTLAARLPDGETVPVLASEDFRTAGSVRGGQGGDIHAVSAEVTEAGARRFTDELVGLNFTSDGVDACDGRPAPNATGYCLVVSLDGQAVSASGITSQFATALRSDQFVDIRRFWIVTGSPDAAHDLELSLVAGPLPTDAAVGRVVDASEGPLTPTPTSTETPGGSGPGFTALAALAALALVLAAVGRP
jgi:hypothetical protein